MDEAKTADGQDRLAVEALLAAYQQRRDELILHHKQLIRLAVGLSTGIVLLAGYSLFAGQYPVLLVIPFILIVLFFLLLQEWELWTYQAIEAYDIERRINTFLSVGGEGGESILKHESVYGGLARGGHRTWRLVVWISFGLFALITLGIEQMVRANPTEGLASQIVLQLPPGTVTAVYLLASLPSLIWAMEWFRFRDMVAQGIRNGQAGEGLLSQRRSVRDYLAKVTSGTLGSQKD